MNWWVTSVIEAGGVGLLVSWSFWVIASVVLHELAHGVAAIRAGDRTPIDTGHMTWNPAVHMGTSGMIMFALVGVTWGFMPVSPSRFRGRYDDAKVAFAGPATNLVLAVVATAAAATIVILAHRGVIDLSRDLWATNTRHFFRLGAQLNFVLVALNLLPLPPLDGSRILANFSRPYREFIDQPQVAGGSLLVLLLIFFFGGTFMAHHASEISLWLELRIVRLFF